MYISVAVCDDDLPVCSQIERILVSIFEDLSVNYDIDIFCSGRDLCDKMSGTNYDIIFLDIRMPEMSGLDTGKYIREILKNEIVQIAFISAKECYAMKLFEYRPINFLVKPVNYKKIRKVIDKYLVISEQNNHVFTYKKGYEFFSVPMSDILYFESKNRKIIIVTKNGSDEFYDSMENIYSFVKNNKFLYIHKSIVVNYRYIKKFSYDQVTMSDGKILSISQSRRKQIREMHLKIKEGQL